MTSSDQNVVFEFDPRKDVLVKKWDVGAACNPNGLAINPKTNQALLGCSNKKTPMTVLWDLKTKKVVTTFTQAGAGDMTVYNAKDNLFFFAASNFPRGAVLAVFTGGPNVRFIGGAPTAVGSHAVGYDQTNRVVYTLDQRPNSAGLMALWLAGGPKWDRPARSRLPVRIAMAVASPPVDLSLSPDVRTGLLTRRTLRTFHQDRFGRPWDRTREFPPSGDRPFPASGPSTREV